MINGKVYVTLRSDQLENVASNFSHTFPNAEKDSGEYPTETLYTFPYETQIKEIRQWIANAFSEGQIRGADITYSYKEGPFENSAQQQRYAEIISYQYNYDHMIDDEKLDNERAEGFITLGQYDAIKNGGYNVGANDQWIKENIK